MELALKSLGGAGFKRILRNYTTNLLKAMLPGIVVTVLQSSSVGSLMVLAFVGAGIIQLGNAIGIVFGSNLGTTFTGWVVAYLGFKLNIESFALPLIAVGGLAWVVFSKSEKLRETGRFLLGFGFLFFGLYYMKVSIDLSVFAQYTPYLFFLVGFALTAVIQSSSAAMVITLSALHAAIISLEAAAAMVIGNDLVPPLPCK